MNEYHSGNSAVAPTQYLAATDIIDWRSPVVLERAHELGRGHSNVLGKTRACFEWVRDQIQHSGDYRSTGTTCRASEVLEHRTGWCFAKSHLLAALLRANDISAGLCYQRLRRDDGRGFSLHGLNAVYLPEFGWYRIDPRGNKPGVNAQFCPPDEQLAWPIEMAGEVDLPEIWPEPLPLVVDCLCTFDGWEQVQANLPDLQLGSPPP